MILIPLITTHSTGVLSLMKRIFKILMTSIATGFPIFGHGEQKVTYDASFGSAFDLHPHRIFPSMDGSTLLKMTGSQLDPVDRVLEHRRGLGRTVHG